MVPLGAAAAVQYTLFSTLGPVGLDILSGPLTYWLGIGCGKGTDGSILLRSLHSRLLVARQSSFRAISEQWLITMIMI